MNEIIYLRIGIWFGYAITSACLILAYYLIMSWKLTKFGKYLYETKQLQKYKEWETKNKFKIRSGGK